MWKSPDGRAHTVALPDPTSAMTDEFVESLGGLDSDARSDLATLDEDAQDDFFDLLDDIEPTEPTSPENDGLSLNYLSGSFESAEHFVEYLSQIETRWQLDALMAVEAYLDELDQLEPANWLRRLLTRFK